MGFEVRMESTFGRTEQSPIGRETARFAGVVKSGCGQLAERGVSLLWVVRRS